MAAGDLTLGCPLKLPRSAVPIVFFILGVMPSLRSQEAIPIPAGVQERSISFPTDGLTAPGTLTVPAQSATNLPILVLVQGSGVQDRDSTIGPNKIFQQIARGLAQRGIATLRYDRRPKFAGASFKAHPDLDHEVVIDAASALAFCTTFTEVDPKRIYLLGHSLGAELAPDIVALRLTQKPGSIRGMILMSGIARPIDAVILDQVRTLGEAQGGTPGQIDGLIAAWTGVFTAARDPTTPELTLLGVGGGQVPATYWRDWLHRNPVKTMSTLHIPALVLRGTLDQNSTHDDFALLTRAATSSGSASREFPGLNHEYLPLPGDNTEVSTAGRIAPALLDTIAQWVKTGHLD
jgi:alpha-beta hydrolase superfamily lysophospholipase